MSAVLAGIDVGGTKIGFCLGTRDGTVLAHDAIPTEPERPPVEVLDDVLQRLDVLRAAGGHAAPVAFGCACPGPLGYAEGRLLEIPNMPAWQHFAIRRFLRERFAVPAAFMNDANAGVLAEHLWGAARDVRNAVFLTMSTGMGAGLLLDGRVYEGPLALAGEIGHIRLREDGPVGFGKRGSVEGYLSGPGIEQVARAERLAFVQAGRSTALATGELSPRRVCELAEQGDPAALAVIDRCGAELGRACAILVDLLNPDLLVLGTIGTAFPGLWEPRIRAVLEREALPAAVRHVRIRPSGLAHRGHQAALAVAARVLEDPSVPGSSRGA